MLHLTLITDDPVPLYRQIMRQIQHLIATGRLNEHDELPAVRVLAEHLVINPNTVVRAYRELEQAGLIYKKRGAGTYVAAGKTRYTDEECRRILAQQADALLVESRNLGYTFDQLVALLKERDRALAKPKTDEDVA